MKKIIFNLLIIFLIFNFGCESEYISASFNEEIYGKWEPGVITKSYQYGMEETSIKFSSESYLFHSNTINGIINQEGIYSFDGEVINLELSFSPNPMALVGKNGSSWEVQLIDEVTMKWINVLDNTEVIKWNLIDSESNGREQEELEDLPLPPEPGNN